MTADSKRPTPADSKRPAPGDGKRPEPAERITIEDVKLHAERVKDLAVSDTKEAVRSVMSQDATRTLAIVAGVVVAAACVGYLLAARRCSRQCDSR